MTPEIAGTLHATCNFFCSGSSIRRNAALRHLGKRHKKRDRPPQGRQSRFHHRNGPKFTDQPPPSSHKLHSNMDRRDRSPSLGNRKLSSAPGGCKPPSAPQPMYHSPGSTARSCYLKSISGFPVISAGWGSPISFRTVGATSARTPL